MLLSGNKVALQILNATELRLQENQLTPGIGVILVGDDAPSHLYVGIKEKRALELGIHFSKKVFAPDVREEEIIATIKEWNHQEDIHGIIVQLPLPDQLSADKVIAAIEPSKDTDGFHPETIKKFLEGDRERLPVFPRAMIELVRSAPEVARKTGLALVNSTLMGEVLVKALQDEGLDAQYILKQEREEIEQAIKEADVILSASGDASSLSTFDCKSGAVIIDGGITYDEKGRVIGDVTRDDGVYREDIWVTTVPGGVGPVTVAVLLARVTEAALRVK
ncbi:MAG: bifunctional 5,10-methylenetetrahydrofolate dehydrogenase/5,10-methenyltetrahydrofolate cyclohydrolase [Patescibacteria group bacterium]